MTSLHVVVGGQYGSEAKGHFTGALSQRLEGRQLHIRVAGPNAGHSVVSPKIGNKIALRQIPVAAVSNPMASLYIAPGSEVELEVLCAEIELLRDVGHPVIGRLSVSPQATLLTGDHKRAEGGNDGHLQNRIGSTGKGIGAARSDRIMRTALLVGDSTITRALERRGIAVTDDPLDYARRGYVDHVVIEGTQGYGLGLHAGFYPFCTSSDCRAIDFVAMAGVSLADFEHKRSYVVYRTFPIRVAGNSGPMYGERDWAQLAEQSGGYIQPERTTVTKKIRRVGCWDRPLAEAAYRHNALSDSPAGRHTVLMFADYIDPSLANSTNAQVVTTLVGRWVDDNFGESIALPCYIGTGPSTGVWTDV